MKNKKFTLSFAIKEISFVKSDSSIITVNCLLPEISSTITAEILHDHPMFTLCSLIYQQYWFPENTINQNISHVMCMVILRL